jgi:hypothetical protein
MAKHRRGSAAIEFALWLPVMLVFVAAVVDYGFYMTRRVSVARATMEGARVGAAVFEPNNVPAGSQIVPAAQNRASEVLTDIGIACPGAGCTITVNFCPAGGGGACGSPPFTAIQVEIDYDISPVFGLVPVPTHIHELQLMAVENQSD